MASIDSPLAVALSDVIERDKRTADSQIEILDNNGMITLSGFAVSNEARAAAAQIAMNYPGVMSVINDIGIGDPDDTIEVPIVAPFVVNSANQRY